MIFSNLESLDELQSLVIRSFSNIKNKKLPKFDYPSDPYGELKRKVSGSNFVFSSFN